MRGTFSHETRDSHGELVQKALKWGSREKTNFNIISTLKKDYIYTNI